MPSLEVGVAEALFVGVVPRLMKVIHVQLPHEGREIIVLEKSREYLLCELIWLFHNEAVAKVIPANDVIQGRVLMSLKK